MPRLLVCLFVLVACGGRSSVSTTLDTGGDLEARVAAARYRVASDPDDAGARRRLAHLELEAERPGLAFEQLEVLARADALSARGRETLAALLVDRGGQRLALGDGAAYRDLDRARELVPDVEIGDALEVAALFEGALAALRHTDARDRAAAGQLLDRLAGRVPDDPRLAARAPATAPIEALGRAAAWAWDGGARRVGTELLDRYVERGGRRPALLERHLDARWWWGGAGALPDILALDEYWAAGVSPCLYARSPEEHACDRTMAEVAADPALASRVWEWAERYRWRTASAEAAGAWVIVALRAWASGQVRSPTAGLRARLDLDALARNAARLAPHAAPLVLHAAGDRDAAAAALDDALDAADDMTPSERGALTATAALFGAGPGTIDRLLSRGAVDPLGWFAAARSARVAGEDRREARLVAEAPDAWARAYLRRGLDLGPSAARSESSLAAARVARWHSLVGAPPLAQGRRAVLDRWRALGHRVEAPRPDVAPVGAPFALEIAAGLGRTTGAGAGELEAIARAFERDPAVADRLAREYAAGRVAAGVRAPLVGVLFARLGDTARALRWFERALDESPRHPEYQFAVGAYAAANGDVPRAEVHFISAAAGSGDPGAASLAAARVFLDVGAPLPALGAGRRAASLTAPGPDIEVLEVLVEAADALDRTGAREAAMRRLHRRVGGGAAEVDQGPASTLVDPERVRRALAAGEVEQVEHALTVAAWNPAATRLRVELLEHLEPGSLEHQRVVAELALIAVAGPRRDARVAYRALSGALGALGAPAAAAAAGREARRPAPLSVRFRRRPGR